MGDSPSDVHSSWEKAAKTYEAFKSKCNKKNVELSDDEGHLTKMGATLELERRKFELKTLEYLKRVQVRNDASDGLIVSLIL